jgi:hypothetical protein
LRLSREFCEEMFVGGWDRCARLLGVQNDHSRIYYEDQEVRGECRGRKRVVAIGSNRVERARSKLNGTAWF